MNEPFKNFDNRILFSSFFSSIHYTNGVLSQYLFTVKSITVKRTMTLAEVYFRTYTIHEVTKKIRRVGWGCFVFTEIFTEVSKRATDFILFAKKEVSELLLNYCMSSWWCTKYPSECNWKDVQCALQMVQIAVHSREKVNTFMQLLFLKSYCQCRFGKIL